MSRTTLKQKALPPIEPVITVPFSVRLDERLVAYLRQVAATERRTVGAQLGMILEDYRRRQLLADDD